MPVRIRNGASSLVEALDLVELREQPLTVEAVGDREPRRVVGHHDVLVAERLAARAIVSIGAPPSDHVEWTWQSPRSAARSAAPSSIVVATRSSRELGDVRGHVAVERLADDARRLRSDAGEVGEPPVGVQASQLVGGRCSHRVGGALYAFTRNDR